MTDLRAIDGLVENWLVVFHRESPVWWVRLLAAGEFRHVSAVGWSRAAGCWVVFDPRLRATMMLALPDDVARGYLDAVWLKDRCTVVSLAAGDGGRARMLGGWCVPAVAQLVGLRSGALRPDALLKDCLRHGGRVIFDENAAAAGRSGADCSAPARGGGPGADGAGPARRGDGPGIPDVRGTYRPLGRLVVRAADDGEPMNGGSSLRPLQGTE